MQFSLLSLVTATLFLALLLGANLTPERINDGPAEQRDYGWPFLYWSEWGPRTKDAFTPIETQFSFLRLSANVLIALGGGLLILKLSFWRKVHCATKSPACGGSPNQ